VPSYIYFLELRCLEQWPSTWNVTVYFVATNFVTVGCLLQVETVEQFLEAELHQRMPSFNMTEFQKQLMLVLNIVLFSPLVQVSGTNVYDRSILNTITISFIQLHKFTRMPPLIFFYTDIWQLLLHSSEWSWLPFATRCNGEQSFIDMKKLTRLLIDLFLVLFLYALLIWGIIVVCCSSTYEWMQSLSFIHLFPLNRMLC